MIGGGNLQILNVKLSPDERDDAKYTCRAENDVDSRDAEAQLTVHCKHRILSLLNAHFF